ncbi:MAG: methylated-DNA--[protein]-cysteine S-methyltransferase [Thermodesulfobacteriota bacterium]|nr:methylated-DNA--[protein]-cysteine S-methyltransferase [Thermodesulfobacteriota bacterium]
MIDSIDTPVGPLFISGDALRIRTVSWKPLKDNPLSGVIDWIIAPLIAYLTGKQGVFPGGLDFYEGRFVWARHPAPEDPHGFRHRVFNETIKVPFGHTMTYGKCARDLGNRHLARAIGGALRSNNLAILVPCHRIIAAGSIGGYNGGVEKKRFLLHLEQKASQTHKYQA